MKNACFPFASFKHCGKSQMPNQPLSIFSKWAVKSALGHDAWLDQIISQGQRAGTVCSRFFILLFMNRVAWGFFSASHSGACRLSSIKQGQLCILAIVLSVLMLHNQVRFISNRNCSNKKPKYFSIFWHLCTFYFPESAYFSLKCISNNDILFNILKLSED